MSDEDDVITAARERGAALVRGDAVALDHILHPDFGWISHQGQHFDRTSYIEANRQPGKRWYDQELRDPHVSVVDRTAVLRCTVRDTVDVGSGRPETFEMPMTQTWVKIGVEWKCLAGHAGPLHASTQLLA